MLNNLNTRVSIESWIDIDDVKFLGKRKQVHEIREEYRELRDKLDKLSELIPFNYPDRGLLIPYLWQEVRSVGSKVQQFFEEFEHEINKRGISPENVNSAKIDIKLPKFNGYESCIDIYSFQTQFEELVYGKVENRLIPSLLKKQLFRWGCVGLS